MSYFDEIDIVEPFHFLREEDSTGVSGEGIVAMGAKLPNGKTILLWRSLHPTLEIFDHFEDMEKIHGHGGKTKIVMGNPKTKKVKKKKE